MSKQVYYKQVVLKKYNGESSYSVQQCWIPEKFALFKKVLKFKNNDNSWDNGWIVEEVFPTRRLESQLPDPHKDIKRHRSATGDSMPKEKK